ncbi:glycerol-3-phosphate responsive antiterminator [Mesoaciditoga sp.]
MRNKEIIAAVWQDTYLEDIPQECETVFLLGATISNVGDRVRLFKSKEVWVDIDFVEGLEKNKTGVKFLKDAGADGVITTKLSLLKECEKIGMPVILRFFALDSHAVRNILHHLRYVSKVEVLPADVLPKLIDTFKNINPGIFVIAAGLISSAEEVRMLFKNGVDAVSIGGEIKKVWREYHN